MARKLPPKDVVIVGLGWTLLLPARRAGGLRWPRDFTAFDFASDLDQFAADWDRPFLEDRWNVASLTNNGYDGDESLCERPIHYVVLSDGVQE